MKQLTIILLALISVAYSQDSTRANFPTDRGGVGYKINNSDLNGRTIDSTRIYKMGSDTVRRVTTNWIATYGGVYGNGSDMTAKINLLDKRSYVNEIQFVYDTTTTITISGALSLTKKVKIEKGVSFIGTGSINFNNNLVEADPDQVIFGSGLTITNIKTSNGLVPARWFGAVADGATDNKGFFDKAQGSISLASGMAIFIAKGTHQINSAFTQSVPFIGDNGAIVKYNPSSSATGVEMWTIGGNSNSLKNITIDASGKCITGIKIGVNTDITLYADTVKNINQVGAETQNAQGVMFGQGCDRLKILNCSFQNFDAKNTGVIRGIRGDYAGTGPIGIEIAYNTFSGIKSTAGSDDADDICIQSFTTDLGMKIHHNKHYSVWKRAVKMMANGIEYYENEMWSSRFATNGTKTYAAISIYGNNNYAHNNTFWSGICEYTIEIGPYQDGSSPVKNVRVENNRIFMSTGGTGAKDGISIVGKNNLNISVINNYMENVRRGIASIGSNRNMNILYNTINVASDNAILVVSTNTFPDNWNYNVNIIGNIIRKCLQAVLSIGRINGGSLSGNAIDSCADDFILNYVPYIDSLLGMTASNNTSTPVGYGSGKRVNFGTYARRLPLTNPNSLPGLQYVASDSSNATYLYQGGTYVKIGASSGGGGAVSSVFGRTGAVVAASNDYTFSQIGSKPTTLSGYGITDGVGNMRKITINGNNYDFSADRDVTGGVRGAISLTTIGTSGAATYNSSTGVLNVPQYSGGGGLPTIPTGYPYISNGSAGGDSSTALYVNRANKTIGINSTATTHSINVGYVADLMGIRLDMPSGYGYIAPRFNNSVELGTSGTGPHIIMHGASNQTTFKQAINQFEGQIYMLGATASRPQMLFADKSAAPSSPTAGWLWRDGDALNYRTSTGTVNLADPGFTNPMTTAGDIIVGGSSGTPTRLAKGTDGQILKMVSGNVQWGTNTLTNGEYVTNTVYELPAFSSVTTDTAIYMVAGDKVEVAGSLTVNTAPGGGTQVTALTLPSSYNSQFPTGNNWAWGTAVVTKTSDGTTQVVAIYPYYLAGNGGLKITFTAAGNTNYKIRFHAFYKYYGT